MADTPKSQSDGWNEYSKLVLSKLDTLESTVEFLRKDVQDVSKEVIAFRAIGTKVDEIKSWKKEMDDVATAPQLKTAIADGKSGRDFAIRATTGLVVLQILIGLWFQLKS